MNSHSNHGDPIVKEIRLIREARATFFRVLLREPSPGTLQLTNQVLGSVDIRCLSVEYISDMAVFSTTLQACEILMITDGGCVHIDSRFSTDIVSRLLEMPPPILPRSLSRVERGVIGCVVASILSELGISSGLDLQKSEPSSPSVLKDGVLINFHVSMSSMSGTVQCFMSQSALEAAWQNGYLASLFLSRTVPYALELCRTNLSHADSAALCVGDAIIFDDVPALLESEPWPVTLHLLDTEIPAIFGLDGDLHLKTEKGFVIQQNIHPADSLLHSNPCQEDEGPMALLPVAQDSPLELIIEVATPSLASDLLWSLLKGETISLGIPRSSRVLVRAGRLSPVTGELISVDGMLAVRITQKWRALPSVDQTTLPLSTI
jgi:hypothetical protein